MKKIFFLLSTIMLTSYCAKSQVQGMDYVDMISNVTHDTGKLYTHIFMDNGKDSAGVKWSTWYVKPDRIGNNYMTGEDYLKYEADNYYVFIYEADLLNLTIIK